MMADDRFSDSFGPSAADLAAPGAIRARGEPITAGFVALVDCAPLIIAREKGFASAEGLDLTLQREPSWANIRDRIVLGHFDAAHMLAPMTIAATLQLTALDVPIVAPFVLDLGGNAITVSNAVYQAMADSGEPGHVSDPRATGLALKRVVAARKAAGEPPLCFGMTYPFSSHNYELRYWLAAAGIDPDHDVRLIVVPPPLMVDAMATGHVDGSCVGAPWPAMMVVANVGHMVATTATLKPSSPEKVLGVRKVWAERHPDRLDRLVRVLDAACHWCDDPANIDELAALLSRPEYVNAPADVIRWSLARHNVTDSLGERIGMADYMRFSGDGANRPRIADALWYATQMVRWGQVVAIDAATEAARRTFRPDLYDRAMGQPPEAGAETGIALFDGIPFDQARPADYLRRLAIPG